MPRKSYVPTSISLNEDDFKKTEHLKSLGYKIVEIFRTGLKVLEQKSKKK